MNISRSRRVADRRDPTGARRAAPRRGRNPIRGRVLAGGLLLAVIGAAAAAAAPAAGAAPLSRASSVSPTRPGQAAPAPAPGRVSWSVIPAGATAPDSRALFAYHNIKPGASIFDHVAVLNHSTQSVAFSIYATDATGTTASNALTLLPANNKPKDIGSWSAFPMRVTQLSIIIPGGKGIIEPFTIAVPHNATPGDHTGGMIASVGVPHRNAAGQMVTLYQRIAVPIELRVAGKLHAALQVESISPSFHDSVNPFGGGSASVSYTIVNTGNVRLRGTQVVTVTGPFGLKSTIKAQALPTVLPGDSVQFTVSPGGLYPAGPLTASVTVTPGWPPNETPLAMPLAQTTGSASLFAVPWSLLGLIILLGGGGFAVWRTSRWRGRMHRAEVAAAAEHARRETERRLLGGKGKPASGAGRGSGQAQAGGQDTSGQDTTSEPE
jgi:hypothetical protein